MNSPQMRARHAAAVHSEKAYALYEAARALRKARAEVKYAAADLARTDLNRLISTIDSRRRRLMANPPEGK